MNRDFEDNVQEGKNGLPLLVGRISYVWFRMDMSRELISNLAIYYSGLFHGQTLFFVRFPVYATLLVTGKSCRRINKFSPQFYFLFQDRNFG